MGMRVVTLLTSPRKRRVSRSKSFRARSSVSASVQVTRFPNGSPSHRWSILSEREATQSFCECVSTALINSYLLALCCDCACTRLLPHVLMLSKFSHEQACLQISARSTEHLVNIAHFDAML